ncbi:MAG TPA: hypothetical protein VD858_07090 [Reyranella sp.]|nr:hypothetical protein [Reyranella sp.]
MGSTATGSAEAFWRGHVEAWQASGQSRGDYCAAQGLSRKTFGWWAWRLDRTRRSVEMESRDGRFLAVEVAGTSVVTELPTIDRAADERIEIALPDGVAVRVGTSFDAEALRRVLEVLGR